MQLNWIKITERAAEGIKIINQLDDDVFTTVINYVHRNMSPEQETTPNDGHVECLEDLEHLVKVDRSDFLLLIKTLSYILKRGSTFIMKPTKFQSELRNKLKLNDSKIDGIMKIWMKTMKPILDNLEMDDGEQKSSRQLDNVAWKLKVQLSSEAQQKEKLPLAQLQFTTTDGQRINLEMNRAELFNIYNQLETIQNELDGLKNK